MTNTRSEPIPRGRILRLAVVGAGVSLVVGFAAVAGMIATTARINSRIDDLEAANTELRSALNAADSSIAERVESTPKRVTGSTRPPLPGPTCREWLSTKPHYGARSCNSDVGGFPVQCSDAMEVSRHV